MDRRQYLNAAHWYLVQYIYALVYKVPYSYTLAIAEGISEIATSSLVSTTSLPIYRDELYSIREDYCYSTIYAYIYTEHSTVLSQNVVTIKWLNTTIEY